MSRRAKAGVVAIACAAALAVVGIGVAGGDGSDDRAQPVEIVGGSGSGRPAESTAELLACTGPEEPASFRLYSLGASFEGLPLTAVIRHCSTPMPVPDDGPGALPGPRRSNSVSYIYGDCEPPSGEEGCAPPLDVQVWPVCERGIDGPRRALARRRGVPAAVSSWIELYTADATVVVFGQDRDLTERAVAALQPVRRGAAPATVPPPLVEAGRLPPPVDGALSGELRCG